MLHAFGSGCWDLAVTATRSTRCRHSLRFHSQRERRDDVRDPADGQERRIGGGALSAREGEGGASRDGDDEHCSDDRHRAGVGNRVAFVVDVAASSTGGLEPSGDRRYCTDSCEGRQAEQAVEDVPGRRRGEEEDTPECGGDKRYEPPRIPLFRDARAGMLGCWVIRSCHGRERVRSSGDEERGNGEHDRGGGPVDA